MRAVRTAAQRGFILAERGYPLLDHHFTPGPGAAETAFVYSISRQESNFDPEARSGVGARLGINVGYLNFTNQPTWNPF